MKKDNMTLASPGQRNLAPIHFVEIISIFFILLMIFGCASLNSENYKSRIRAVNKITDQNILYKIALEDINVEVKVAAFNKINDEDLINKLVFESKDPQMRLMAIDKITDQEILLKVTLKDSDKAVRTAAFNKITDQNVLVKVALEDTDKEVKASAFNKITDENLINKLAFESKDPQMRLMAINKITDQNILFKVALEDINNEAKAAAFNKITDENLINKLAFESKDPQMRLMAINKITDQNILFKVALEDINGEVKSAAFNKITDQNILYKIALEDKSDMQVDAMKRLSPGLLAKLAFDFEESALKLKVIELLSDQNELMNISQNSDDWNVRQAAFKKLDDNSLDVLTRNVKDPSTVLAAKIRLGQISWKEAFSGENGSTGTLGDVIGAAAIVDTPQPESSDVVSACHNYIKRGDSSRIPELINLLNRFGDITLAEDYLNCGNDELYDAGANWGRSHGYRIQTGYGSHRVRWGQKY